MTHEGWKNWETWNTASWCDKDELIHRDRMRRRPRAAEECEAFVRDWQRHPTRYCARVHRQVA
jgi:hypothetical protein